MITIDCILDVEALVDSYNAVIFDLDDTLYSEKEYVRSGYHLIAEHFPDIRDMEEKLWNAFLRGEPAIDAVLLSEGKLDQNNKNAALQIYRYQTPVIHLYTGVMEMLIRLKRTKKVGLITDGRPEGQRAKIEALQLSTRFDVIIITDELGGTALRKPNPEAFKIMQQRMQVAFESMVYIGDNPQKDFVAPEQLGMGAILFNNRDGLY